MAQSLKPGMLNFQKIEIDQSETSENSSQPGEFIKNRTVATGKNGVQFQPVTIQEPENELENLWATAKKNDDVYQSVVETIKKPKHYLRFLFSNFLSVIVR